MVPPLSPFEGSESRFHACAEPAGVVDAQALACTSPIRQTPEPQPTALNERGGILSTSVFVQVFAPPAGLRVTRTCPLKSTATHSDADGHESADNPWPRCELFQAPAPARGLGASVTFEPGSRTAWHAHPLGQTLIVTAGCGWAQRQGGPVEEIRPGDVVWFPPGEKHWHGATPTTAMTHIAIQEKLDGKVVDWMGQVGDEQYRR